MNAPARLLTIGRIAVALIAYARYATGDDLKACTAEQESEWKLVREQQLGIQARALNGAEWVGLTAATDGFHDWAPLDDYKTTICGKLSRLGLFEPNRTSPVLGLLPEIPEHDWNIVLVPTPDTVFNDRFNLALRVMERGHESDRLSCDGTPCFEAEITPPADLLKANASHAWLSDARRGETVCTFGPWVGDGGHGYRPEIHPAERIWRCNGSHYKLLTVQDASQRFTDHRQFLWGYAREPKNWRPWAVPGLEGEFRLAFAMKPNGNVRFHIEQELEGKVRAVAGSLKGVQPPIRFVLAKDGKSAGEVSVATLGVSAGASRLQLDPAQMSMRVDACLRSDGDLQGFLSLRNQVGYAYSEGEGFEVLDVVQEDCPCKAQPQPAPAAEGNETLRTTVHILANEVDDSAPPEASSASLLDDLLRAATARGQSQATPSVADELAQVVKKNEDLRLGVSRRFRLSIRPHYDGPREEALEAAVNKGDATKLKQLLQAMKAAAPDQVKWSITLADVTSGGGEVTTECAPNVPKRLLVGDECEIELPDSFEKDHVWLVSAKASLQSQGSAVPTEVRIRTAGSSDGGVNADTRPAEQSIRLSTHFIRLRGASAREKVLRWLDKSVAQVGPSGVCQERVNSPAPSLVAMAADRSLATLDEAGQRRGYYARMLLHGLVLASSDHRLTLDELSQFLYFADSYARVPCLSAVPEMGQAK